MPKKVYPELNTVVSMCEHTLLTTSQKQELAEAASFEEALSLILSWNFFATGDTDDYKSGLDKEKYYWIGKFAAISPECFIKLFELHDAFYAVKIFVKETLLGKTSTGLYIPYCPYDREYLSSLEEKSEKTAFDEKMLSLAGELKEDYEKHKSLTRLDLLTSFFEFETLEEYAKQTKDEDVVEAVRRRIDLDLISLALVSRGKNIPYSDSTYEQADKVSLTFDFRKMLAQTDGENLKMLENTPYKDVYKAAMTPEGRLNYDTLADDVIIAFCKKAKFQPFGLFMVYAFLYVKMADIKNVRVAMLAKSSGSDKETVRERMRGTYEL